MVGAMGMEVVALHQLEGETKKKAVTEAVAILNCEWPRSETIRKRGLESSSPNLPCSLVMFSDGRVLGHARLSKLPALPEEVKARRLDVLHWHPDHSNLTAHIPYSGVSRVCGDTPRTPRQGSG